MTAIRARIHNLYADKIGTRAAELEYQSQVNRLWIGGMALVALAIGALAEGLQSLPVGLFSILAGLFMVALLGRAYLLRHKFFQAVSTELKIHVNALHPVRGLPNWRRQLSDQRMRELNEQFNAWCKARGVQRGEDPA